MLDIDSLDEVDKSRPELIVVVIHTLSIDILYFQESCSDNLFIWCQSDTLCMVIIEYFSTYLYYPLVDVAQSNLRLF